MAALPSSLSGLGSHQTCTGVWTTCLSEGKCLALSGQHPLPGAPSLAIRGQIILSCPGAPTLQEEVGGWAQEAWGPAPPKELLADPLTRSLTTRPCPSMACRARGPAQGRRCCPREAYLQHPVLQRGQLQVLVILPGRAVQAVPHLLQLGLLHLQVPPSLADKPPRHHERLLCLRRERRKSLSLLSASHRLGSVPATLAEKGERGVRVKGGKTVPQEQGPGSPSHPPSAALG